MSSQDEICMLCENGIRPDDRIGRLSESYARVLCGSEPSERSRTTDHRGRLRYLAHAPCIREAKEYLEELVHDDLSWH